MLDTPIGRIPVNPTEIRIRDLKRKTKLVWESVFPLRGTDDSFTQVKMQVDGLQEAVFVSFAAPDWQLLGADVTLHLPQLRELLQQKLGRAVRLRAVTQDGRRLAEESPLFEQLGPDKTVYVNVAEDWPEEVDDNGTADATI